MTFEKITKSTLEESQKALDEIREQQPSIEDMLGTKNE